MHKTSYSHFRSSISDFDISRSSSLLKFASLNGFAIHFFHTKCEVQILIFPEKAPKLFETYQMSTLLNLPLSRVTIISVVSMTSTSTKNTPSLAFTGLRFSETGYFLFKTHTIFFTKFLASVPICKGGHSVWYF